MVRFIAERGILKRILFIGFALVLIAIGVIGIFVPLLPTTPFLLAAAFLLARSSPALHNRMLRNHYIGSFIRHYREHTGVPRGVVVRALIFLWVTLGFSIVLLPPVWLKIFLTLVGIGVSIYLLLLKRTD